MAIIIGKRTNLDAPIKVESLNGVTFTSEAEAHQFVVRCEQRGQELTLAGTISAKFIRADGNTIQLVGSIVDGAAVVTLAQDCYNVQGRFQLAIFNTVGNAKLCIYACVGTVQKAQSGNLIDGGSIIPDVEDLIADIQAARETIPPTYDTLLASIAGTYDSTKTYAVGDYAWYEGALKRCIVPITTAESWMASHWADAVIGDDVSALKSAINKDEEAIGYETIELQKNKSITTNTTNPILPANIVSENGFACCCVSCQPGDKFTVTGSGGNSTRLWAFANSNGERLSQSGASATANELLLYAPDNAAYFACNVKTNFAYDVRHGQKTIEYINDINDTLNQIDIRKKSFTVAANASHSSTLDIMSFSIKEGEEFYFGAFFDATAATGRSMQLYGYKSDGSANAFSSGFYNTFKLYTAPEDLAGLSLFVGSGANEVSFTIKAFKKEEVTGYLYGKALESTETKSNLDALTEQVRHNAIGKNLVGGEANVYYPVYIPAGQSITWAHEDGTELITNSFYVVSYNADKEQLSSYGAADHDGMLSRTVVPSASQDTYYIRLSDKPAHGIQIELGTESTAYKPYFDNVRAVKTELEDTKTNIETLGKTSFTVDANAPHSSTLDTMPFNISAGETFYAGIFSDTDSTDRTLVLYGADPSTSLGSKALNKIYKLTSPSNFTKLGLFVGSGSEAIALQLIAFKANDIIGRVYESSTDKPSISEIDDRYRVFDIFHICKFTVEADQTHSGIVDTIDMNLKAGDQFYVYASGEGGRQYGVCTISDGTTSAQIGSALVNQISGPFTATFDMTKLSFYTPRASVEETMTFVIMGVSTVLPYLYKTATEDAEFVRKLNAASRKSSTGRYSAVTTPVPFMIAHFSDIHGNAGAMANAQEFKNTYANYIDDMICTGDMVTDHFSQGMDFWNNNSDGSILMCIGNHDSLGENGWANPVDQTTMYQRYIAPYIDRWNATTVANHTYWYKDYPEKKIRLIALDATIFDSTEQDAQMTWYTETLSDALSKDYAVVGAEHFPPLPATFAKINSNFTALNHTTAGDMSQFAWYGYNTRILAATQTFIDNGGNFACWLSGHTHGDLVSYDTRYPKQLFITITCAMPSSEFDEVPRSEGKDRYAINVVAIDTAQKYVKVIRNGPRWDFALRHKGHCVFNYADNPATVVYYG